MKNACGKANLVILNVMLALCLSEVSIAQRSGPPANVQGITADQDTTREVTTAQVSVTFESARHLVESYGLNGRKSLPPGIARNLARGKPLPPGLQLQPVPQIMLDELPVFTALEWTIAGDDLLLLSKQTMLVEELFRGVFH